ncbi:hypothetical protein RYD26_12665, partial [Pasteurellaceae bacterium LIM206]|nr:hypothetical protein [Pasteurellaceae bacterium LIM206]
GGVVDNGDGTLKVLPGVTRFKITTPIVEDNKTEGDETVKYTIDDVEGNEATIKDTSTTPDTTADKPTVTPSATDGSVTVTPGADNEKVVTTLTGEDDQPKTITATKQQDGTWKLEDPDSTGATIDPNTGTITIPQDGVKDGSEVTAKGSDGTNEAT